MTVLIIFKQTIQRLGTNLHSKIHSDTSQKYKTAQKTLYNKPENKQDLFMFENKIISN